MIQVVLAALLSVFSLVPTAPPIIPTFALTGFTLDQNGIATVTDGPPTIDKYKGQDTIRLAFVSPVKGVCVVGETVTRDGVAGAIPLGARPANKDATLILEVTLPTKDDLDKIDVQAEGYTIFVTCGDPTVPGSALFSQSYHHDLPSSSSV